MIISNQVVDTMSKATREALVDQLRSCQNKEEILSFEKSFNEKAGSGPLYKVICDFLRTRSISRGLAAKWLSTILDNHYYDKKPV